MAPVRQAGAEVSPTVHIDGTALVNVLSIHMRQARCRQIDAGAGDDPMLDRNVV
jgi:hypothetical protein